jgi:hypothetical protein
MRHWEDMFVIATLASIFILLRFETGWEIGFVMIGM